MIAKAAVKKGEEGIMASKRIRSKITLLLLVFAAVLGCFLMFETQEGTPNEKVAEDDVSADAAETVGDIVPIKDGGDDTEQGAQAPAQSQEELSEQVIATRRMYQAHASLRSEEVDNPDSRTNQVIKREMIMKALENAKSDL